MRNSTVTLKASPQGGVSVSGCQMSRQHFEAIAGILKSLKPAPRYVRDFMTTRSQDRLNQWEDSLESFAALCQRSNPLFDRSRFLKAAGWEGAVTETVIERDVRLAGGAK